MFGKNKFSAVAALAGLTAAALTPELVTAANEELEEKGITGAALITATAFESLEATAKAHQANTDALKAAGVDSVAALVKQRDDANAKAGELGKQPGADSTTPVRADGKSDIEEATPDANQKIVDDLHAKMLGEI